MALGHAGRQHSRMGLSAAHTAAAVEPVFVHLRAHRRHFEDLMALRRAGQVLALV